MDQAVSCTLAAAGDFARQLQTYLGTVVCTIAVRALRVELLPVNFLVHRIPHNIGESGDFKNLPFT